MDVMNHCKFYVESNSMMRKHEEKTTIYEERVANQLTVNAQVHYLLR